MARPLGVVLLLVLLALSSVPFCISQACSKTFTLSPIVFSTCSSLPTQSASLAWSLFPSDNTLHVLFSGVPLSSSGWVGWGINLGSSPAMIGTQALIAFQAPTNGSNLLTYNVTSATKAGSPLQSTPIDLQVLDRKVQITASSVLIYVYLQLQPNQTVVNHVWNRGTDVVNFQPQAHPFAVTDLASSGRIDLATGVSTTSEAPNQILKNRHAVLNTVGWGILLPVGVVAARYLRPLTDPGWFYVHIFIQMVGYTLGVAGWATGLKLGNSSVGVVYLKHRNIGITLFAIATLQVMAIMLRPKKDHKIRKAWNIYHYFLGLSILTLGILNIFYGFDILLPPAKWRHAYIGVLGALAGITVVFEATTWIHFWMRGRSSELKLQGATVGGPRGEVNGHRAVV